MTKKPPRDTATPDPAEPAPPSLPAGARFPRPSEPLGPPTPEQAARWKETFPEAWAKYSFSYWSAFLHYRENPRENSRGAWTDSAGLDALLAAGLLPEGWTIPRDFKTRVLSLRREPGFPEGPDWAPIHAWLGQYLEDAPQRRKKLFVPPWGEGAGGHPSRIKAVVDEYVAANKSIRTREGETGRLTSKEREWLHGLLRAGARGVAARQVEACLKAHGIQISHRTIQDHQKNLRASERRG